MTTNQLLTLLATGFESGRGQPLSGTQGNRVATVALLMTV